MTTSMACLMPILEGGIHPDVVAGLSLGEYTAHVVAGTFKFADLVKLTKKRGKFMQEAVPLGVGGMVAVIGLSAEEVIEVCKESSHAGIVEPANFNCPGQVVIAGEIPALQVAMDIALKKGAARAIMLQVSAPFHCSMMKPAGISLEKELQALEVHEIKIPLITNVTADYVTDVNEVKPLLIRQVSSPVRWEDGIRRMIADGVDTFVEIGPGKTLTGFLRKIDKEVQGYNVEDVDSFNAFMKKIKE
jgi:[acyl-carrier-protein] S-malonyltransferase